MDLKQQRRNKIKYLHKKRVQLLQDLFGPPTWPSFHCMAAVTSCETALSQTEGQLWSIQQTEGQDGHHLFKVDNIKKKDTKEI